MLQIPCLVVAVGTVAAALAFAFSLSPTPASAEQVADLAVVRHTLVDPPSQIALNSGVGMQVSLSFKNFTPTVDPAPADIFYTLSAPGCLTASRNFLDTRINFGGEPGVGFSATLFCTEPGLKTFASRVEIQPRSPFTDSNQGDNVSIVEFDVLVGAINVTIDIKPGSDPNCVNPQSDELEDEVAEEACEDVLGTDDDGDDTLGTLEEACEELADEEAEDACEDVLGTDDDGDDDDDGDE